MKKTKDQQINHLQTLLKDADDSSKYNSRLAAISLITSTLLLICLIHQLETVKELAHENRYHRIVNRERMEKYLHKQSVDYSHRVCDRFTRITKITHIKYFNEIGCVANGVELDSIDKLNSAIDHFKLGAK